MKGDYRTISQVQEAAEDGCLYVPIFLEKWGLKIRPQYHMDRIIFSFIEVGKSGKGNSFEIFMDIKKANGPCFSKWVRDILSPTRKFETILNEEKKAGEKYAKYYKYITGENADKSIGICNSTKGGYCISASIPDKNAKEGDKNKSIYVNIPIQFSDLEGIAEDFLYSYAGRKAELEGKRKAKEEENWAYFQNKKEDTAQSQPVQQQNTTNTAEVTEPKNVIVATVSLPAKGNNEFLFNGITSDNKPIILHVKNETLMGEQAEEWKNLSSELKNGDKMVKFEVEKTNNQIFINKIL